MHIVHSNLGYHCRIINKTIPLLSNCNCLQNWPTTKIIKTPQKNIDQSNYARNIDGNVCSNKNKQRRVHFYPCVHICQFKNDPCSSPSQAAGQAHLGMWKQCKTWVQHGVALRREGNRREQLQSVRFKSLHRRHILLDACRGREIYVHNRVTLCASKTRIYMSGKMLGRLVVLKELCLLVGPL